MILKHKTIVITGGTSGIGREMVKVLSIDNEVIVIGRNSEKLASLATQHQGLHVYQADLVVQTDVNRIAIEISKRFPHIDVLINNAALQYSAVFLDDNFNPQHIADEISVNLTSVCNLTYQLLSALRHGERALILNVNSGLALAPKTSSAVYCATKAALNTFSQSLSYQLENTNIRILQAFLELVDTPMTQGRGDKKMSATHAANLIVKGLNNEIANHHIGKVKLLNFLLRIAPSIAKKIMKKY
ncbi:MAG: SDR family NAD(P)-dependent oxidoreductase [Colwellia sp.]|nr:SDR family NAD(P)-dependent oxidoreductase [Colwellia sp.]